MRATRFNHVSISAADLEESARFYESVFGMERLPTPDFDPPVLWLRLGEQQLHLFRRDADAPRYHHVGLDVDDFEAVLVRARELGVVDEATFGPMRELSDGAVQLYLRDPAGNLVEIDWPDAASLDRAVVGEIPRLADVRPQAGEAARATLYHGSYGRRATPV